MENAVAPNAARPTVQQTETSTREKTLSLADSGMENSRMEKPFCYSSHRHLRSQTYRTLIQILSACYDHSQVSAPQQPRPATAVCERGELVSPDSLVPDDSRAEKETVVNEIFETTGVEEGAFREERLVIDEIEDMMQTEEDGDLLKHEGLVAGDGNEVTACQDNGFDCRQMLIDELEHIVKGNDQLVEKNSTSFAATSMPESQSGVDASMNNKGENLGVQHIAIEECGDEARLEGDKGPCILKVDLKPSEDIEDRSSPRTSEHEMRQKEMEPEKADDSRLVGSENYISKDVEVEEGEISGDFEVNDVLLDILLDDSVVSEEKKVGERQVSQDLIDKRDFLSNEQNRVNEKFNGSPSLIMNAVDHDNSDRGVELEESVGRETQFKSNNVVHGTSVRAIDSNMYNCTPISQRNKRKASVDEKGVVYPGNPPVNGEILEQGATGMQRTASKEKLDSGVGNKKKRVAPSKEKKAKKKQKERKRRAEKNRQLGLKRLKLRPVVKPKTVEYCRHYLMGRCHEGDKCKYSHDTVPLTKSKPCCHFARNSCMKGDDCPFDHQLCNYPCNNFVANGFCNRGDNCMFSHKIPPKEDALSAPSGGKNEQQPLSLLNVPNSQKPNLDRISHQNADVSNSRKVSSPKITEHNVAGTVLKPPALAPKGINCLFLGKSSALQSGNIKHGNSSPNRNANGNVGNQPEPSVSSTFRDMNETPKKTPAAVSAKGVNFLSFGSASLEYSSGKKLSSLVSNGKDGLKSSLVNNVSGHKLASSCSDGENNAKIGIQTTQSVSSAIQISNEFVKKIAPPGMNFSSNKKVLVDASTCDKKNCLPPSSGNGTSTSLQEIPNTLDKHQNSTGIPWRLLGSPLASGHSKSTANSAKAVECTLAIASKINASAVRNEFNNETRGASNSSSIGTGGGSLNESAKTSKILEFLSGFGNKAAHLQSQRIDGAQA